MLLRLFVYFDNSLAVLVAGLGAILLCIAWGLPRQREGSFATATMAASLLFALLWSITRFRGIGVVNSSATVAAETVTYVAVVFFGAILVTTARSQRELNQRLIAVAISPAIYVLFNVLMYLAGLTSPIDLTYSISAGHPAVLLSFIGVDTARVLFPTAISVNLFGVVAAAGLAAAAVLLTRGDALLPTWAKLGLIAGSVLALAYSDSRVAMVVAIISVLIVLYDRRQTLVRFLPYVIPVLPLLVIFGLGALEGVGGNLFSRGGADDAATGSNRTFIWGGIWDVLRHVSAHTIYGWGGGGQITSGATLRYAYVFGVNPTASTVPAHNATLQILLDAGLIGIVVYVFVVARTILILRDAARRGLTPALALIASISVVVLCGGTEVTPTYYSEEALLIVMTMGGVAAGLDFQRRQRPPRSPSTSADPYSDDFRLEPVPI